MSNVVVWQIDPTTGNTRLGGDGNVYADMAAAMVAAEAAADAFIIAASGTKVVNNTSNRVYVIQDNVVSYEDDVQPGDAAGDGVNIDITRQFIGCKWYCIA